jgi:hypothetical protein
MHRSRIALLALAALACVACGPSFRITTLAAPSLRPRTEGTARAGGLEVTVTPITPATMRAIPNASVPVGVPSGVTRYPTLPMPAFQVRIVNRTGHVVRLDDAVFRLDAPASGERYHALESTSEVIDWARGFYGTTLVKNPMLAAQLGAEISRLPLLNHDAVLLDGDDSTYLLAFQLPMGSPAELEEFLRTRSELVLRLAEVPVAFDQAGAVTTASDLRFSMDAQRVDVRVLCEANQNTWQTCVVLE